MCARLPVPALLGCCYLDGLPPEDGAGVLSDFSEEAGFSLALDFFPPCSQGRRPPVSHCRGTDPADLAKRG